MIHHRVMLTTIRTHHIHVAPPTTSIHTHYIKQILQPTSHSANLTSIAESFSMLSHVDDLLITYRLIVFKVESWNEQPFEVTFWTKFKKHSCSDKSQPNNWRICATQHDISPFHPGGKEGFRGILGFLWLTNANYSRILCGNPSLQICEVKYPSACS